MTMQALTRTVVYLAIAACSAAYLSAARADENSADPPQSSWNDYPVKNFGNYDIPNVTPPAGDVPDNPSGDVPSVPSVPTVPTVPDQPRIPAWPLWPPGQQIPPGWKPPRQQQQGKPSGGKIPGGQIPGGPIPWGGKQGGSWGKMKPPQSQQNIIPGGVPGSGQLQPNQAQLLQYLQMLQAQNAQLRRLVEQLAGRQQGDLNDRGTNLPNGGVPVQ
jgi:hypothetical protein